MFEFISNMDDMVAPAIESHFNRGLLMDIPQGSYVIGNRGENILIGGIPYVFSYAGPGNTGKTEELLDCGFSTLAKVPSSTLVIYDSENSLKWRRLQRIADRYPQLKGYNLVEHSQDPNTRVLFIKRRNMGGEKFWELVKALGEDMLTHKAENMRTLPYRDMQGRIMRETRPVIILIDTLTHFSNSKTDDGIVAKNELGDSKNQTIFMRDGLMKTQLFIQLPNLTGKYGFRIGMSSHVGTRIEINPYAGKAPKLTFGKSSCFHKGVPEKFSQINDHLLEIFSSDPMINSKDKLSEYPDGDVDKKKNTDLMLCTMVNSRNKGGPSGLVFPIIYSQSEGILEHLTLFNYCRRADYFGIGGSTSNYFVELCPEFKLRRGNVRASFRTIRKLQRAIEFTTDLLQIRQHWRMADDIYLMEPKEIYQRCIDQGYEWDTLLNTRGYFMYHEDEVDQLPYLSTLDLLEVAAGKRHPYFLKDDKKTVIEKHWKFGDWK